MPGRALALPPGRQDALAELGCCGSSCRGAGLLPSRKPGPPCRRRRLIRTASRSPRRRPGLPDAPKNTSPPARDFGLWLSVQSEPLPGALAGASKRGVSAARSLAAAHRSPLPARGSPGTAGGRGAGSARPRSPSPAAFLAGGCSAAFPPRGLPLWAKKRRFAAEDRSCLVCSWQPHRPWSPASSPAAARPPAGTPAVPVPATRCLQLPGVTWISASP